MNNIKTKIKFKRNTNYNIDIMDNIWIEDSIWINLYNNICFSILNNITSNIRNNVSLHFFNDSPFNYLSPSTQTLNLIQSQIKEQVYE